METFRFGRKRLIVYFLRNTLVRTLNRNWIHKQLKKYLCDCRIAQSHLFNKNEKIVCNKISGSKMLIYMSDEYPLFVDGTGK